MFWGIFKIRIFDKCVKTILGQVQILNENLVFISSGSSANL